MGWAGRFFFPKSHKEDKNSLNISTACLFKKTDVQYAITGKCRIAKPRYNIKALNIDSRSGVLRASKHHFFPINRFPDFAYEAPRRGPLLWPVIHSVQSSPTPSSSTSRSLFPIESESVSSQYQDILSLLLNPEVRDKTNKKKKNSENAERTTIRSGQIVTF